MILILVGRIFRTNQFKKLIDPSIRQLLIYFTTQLKNATISNGKQNQSDMRSSVYFILAYLFPTMHSSILNDANKKLLHLTYLLQAKLPGSSYALYRLQQMN